MRRLVARGALALLLAGCNAGAGPARAPAASVLPTVTPVGVPQGASTSQSIGPAGGTLGGDAGVTVTVPQGSVSAASLFTATPISSHAPGAIGTAYRLESSAPLTGPVQVTFSGPASYPAGLGLRSLAIRYQDASGFWRAPDALAYDVAANTVTATTRHLSDWALVVGSAPALTGTFTLAQSVGTPFTASGTAALYAWSTTPGDDPTYHVTGIATVPSVIALAGEACVPDAPAQALDLSIAEVHGGSFRWGLDARWVLTCTDAATGAVSSRDAATLFDTLQINLTRCAGAFVGPQVNEAGLVQGSYAIDCGAEGAVSATWDFRACLDGLVCQPADCRVGALQCDGGAGTCIASGLALEGTPCGSGQTCDATGACI